MDPMNWTAFFDRSVAGNALTEWAAAIVVFIVTWGGLVTLRWIVSKYLTKASARTATQVDDVVAKVLLQTRWVLYVPVALYAGGSLLNLPTSVAHALGKIALVGVLIQVGIWVTVAIHRGVDVWVGSKGETTAGHYATMAAALKFVSELVLWSLIAVFVLANIGIEVSALLAGLGVGGIAVALAAQNVLGDLFASVSIYLDRPFDIGDFIVIDDMRGTVERVGLRSSRIRSISGEELIFPNRNLVESRIQNFKRMAERRIAFALGVVYGTPHALLERIPQLVKEVVESIDGLRLDRCHFKDFGDFSLNFEIVYFVNSSEYVIFMDRQQAINLEIYRRFEDLGIEFAFPTQTVFLQTPPTPPPTVA